MGDACHAWVLVVVFSGIEDQAEAVVVVELNMGQVMQEVKRAVDFPERVFLANRIDGVFITPMDIRKILRLIQGKGV